MSIMNLRRPSRPLSSTSSNLQVTRVARRTTFDHAHCANILVQAVSMRTTYLRSSQGKFSAMVISAIAYADFETRCQYSVALHCTCINATCQPCSCHVTRTAEIHSINLGFRIVHLKIGNIFVVVIVVYLQCAYCCSNIGEFNKDNIKHRA